MIPYLPDGVYADLRTASNIRFQLQAELTRIQNRMVFRLKRRKSALIGLIRAIKNFFLHFFIGVTPFDH